jgi:hypothetical protein
MMDIYVQQIQKKEIMDMARKSCKLSNKFAYSSDGDIKTIIECDSNFSRSVAKIGEITGDVWK